ncbi:MAG TPA: GIY-YIG nuclease family protein [Pedobacter sp.]|uniref:GIY-YIG nuclease family protein n=1 Tax=Pedobacter sp. TaxID=1411316 RepID=UPI002BAB8312|nr:GIY-YIG nuclease family protein [Pedobacter sp.]HMI05315.1 GIY-YIG nuclease family protein [Pedobacter sp.]
MTISVAEDFGNTGVVYVLRLENDNYYIGYSTNLKRRLAQHEQGVGAKWTIRHRPLELVEVIEHANLEMENVVTKQYVNKYGSGRVRGGNYCTVDIGYYDAEKQLTSELKYIDALLYDDGRFFWVLPGNWMQI